LLLARDLGYLPVEIYGDFDRQLCSVRKMLTALQLKLKEDEPTGRMAKAAAASGR
jgi:hypothetical protein